MHLIGPLVGGIRGAESGHAEIYERGTSTRATYYWDFEGDTPIGTGVNVQLDANGGTSVYVNQYVDVRVYSSNGTLVRSFTQGNSSPDVEVRSNAFTGVDYATGNTLIGYPTTLQQVLDLWAASSGSYNWLVNVGGNNITIQNALGALAGIFYNVKDPTYGALGDGATDDTASIQAAIDACETGGGGIVYFPSGNYVISTGLTVPAEVNLLGSGPNSSVIQTNSAAAGFAAITFGEDCIRNWQTMSGLSVTPILATDVGSFMVALGTGVSVTKVKLIDCYLGGPLMNGYGVATSATSALYMDACVIEGGGNNCYALALLGPVNWVIDCLFVAPADLSGLTLLEGFLMIGGGVYMRGCRFDNSACAAGAYDDIWFFNISPIVVMTDCNFTAAGGATVNAFDFAQNWDATWYFYEDNNVYQTDEIFGVVGVAFWTASATKQMHFGSLAGRSYWEANNGGARNVPRGYGMYTIKRTDATNLVLTILGCYFENQELIVVVDNSANANAITLADNGINDDAGPITVGIGMVRTRHYRAANIGGALAWVLIGPTSGDLT